MTKPMSPDVQPTISPEIQRQITQSGLDLEAILHHQANIKSHLASSSPMSFPIIDTCRLSNGGIRTLPAHKISPEHRQPIVAFVPAAGASSRYLAPLTTLMDGLRSRDAAVCKAELSGLQKEGILDCPLPSSIKELISFLETSSKAIPDSLASRVLLELDAPKALYPAVLDGTSFLELKRLEHVAIDRFSGEIFICPPKYSERFLSGSSSVTSNLNVFCYEQGASLATTRFDKNGDIAFDHDGQISSVPAGHGSLLQLLPRVSRDCKTARGAFIRNIDNVSGTSSQVIDASQRFLDAFSLTLGHMDEIRQSAANHQSRQANLAAQKILSFWETPCERMEDALSKLFLDLFHAPPEAVKSHLQQLTHRPLVLMGQVPNTGLDVGGGCVFTTIDGVPQKLCLEAPHASAADKRTFLENPALATHFNPVFVATEIPTPNALSNWNKHPFWLIAKKSWRGRDTYYQESILYEMLGNSQNTNAIFVEVPRFVFNPHKTLKDAAMKRRSHWCV
jgi:Domain of unknown function (DUF4301)